MNRLTSLFAGLVLALPGVLHAQHAGGSYAQHMEREIKALSPSQVEDLREGRGMGLSLPAELNGAPGPLHVLELRTPLQLTDEQIAKVVLIQDQMKLRARELGASIIKDEGGLEQLFRGGGLPQEAQIQEVTARIAQFNGALRSTHLVAHLKTRELLTESQVATYNKVRGYSAQAVQVRRTSHSHEHPTKAGPASQ